MVKLDFIERKCGPPVITAVMNDVDDEQQNGHCITKKVAKTAIEIVTCKQKCNGSKCNTVTPGVNYCWQCRNNDCTMSTPKPCLAIDHNYCYTKSVSVDDQVRSMEFGCSADFGTRQTREAPCIQRGKAKTCTTFCRGSSCNTPLRLANHDNLAADKTSLSIVNPDECAKVFSYGNSLYTGCTSRDHSCK